MNYTKLRYDKNYISLCQLENRKIKCNEAIQQYVWETLRISTLSACYVAEFALMNIK